MSRGWLVWMWLTVFRLALTLTAGMALMERLSRTFLALRWQFHLVRLML